MRLFFGIPIEKEDRLPIENISNRMKERYQGNFTIMDNAHMTLIFIGEVEEKLSYMLAQIGDMAFSSLESFSIEARRIESFKEGKVNYLKVRTVYKLTKLHNSLKNLLDKEGIVYNSNERFCPHITIRRGVKIPISEDTDTYTFDVKRVCLFESKRVDGVLRYIPLKTWTAKER